MRETRARPARPSVCNTRAATGRSAVPIEPATMASGNWTSESAYDQAVMLPAPSVLAAAISPVSTTWMAKSPPMRGASERSARRRSGSPNDGRTSRSPPARASISAIAAKRAAPTTVPTAGAVVPKVDAPKSVKRMTERLYTSGPMEEAKKRSLVALQTLATATIPRPTEEGAKIRLSCATSSCPATPIPGASACASPEASVMARSATASARAPKRRKTALIILCARAGSPSVRRRTTSGTSTLESGPAAIN